MSKNKPSKKATKATMSNHTPDLNPMQRLFCLEYLRDLHGTDAAIRAGYSERSAHCQATRLLKTPKIQKYVAEAMAEREEAVKLDAQYVLERLGKQTEADFADLFDHTDDKMKLLPMHKWPKIWRQGLISGFDRDPLTGCIEKIRISDRTKILELLGKHVKVNAFKESIHVEGDLLTGIEITFVKAEVDPDE